MGFKHIEEMIYRFSENEQLVSKHGEFVFLYAESINVKEEVSAATQESFKTKRYFVGEMSERECERTFESKKTPVGMGVIREEVRLFLYCIIQLF